MNRRNFLNRNIMFWFSGYSSLYVIKSLFANAVPNKEGVTPDIVAVMGGEPDKMFDSGIRALGGIRKFVKPNQTVLVKPNIGWDIEPERGANTHPLLVGQIVKHPLDAGAKQVYVLDHTCDVWKKCYKTSRIEFQAKKFGGTMVQGNLKHYYHPICIPDGKILKSAMVHELFLSSDIVINVPVLKHHDSARLTSGMKNLMGVVWDRRWWHANGLHQCIADFSTFRKPDLVVIDAYRVIKKNGPRGISEEDVALQKAQILSRDPVAADTAATKLFGLNPRQINYIKAGEYMGIGSMDLSALSIRKIKIH